MKLYIRSDENMFTGQKWTRKEYYIITSGIRYRLAIKYALFKVRGNVSTLTLPNGRVLDVGISKGTGSWALTDLSTGMALAFGKTKPDVLSKLTDEFLNKIANAFETNGSQIQDVQAIIDFANSGYFDTVENPNEPVDVETPGGVIPVALVNELLPY